MPLPERKALAHQLRGMIISVCLVSALAISGCTVRPLYSDATAPIEVPTKSAGLSSVNIKPVETRYAQEVRNHLIFLMNGGSGQPANAEYALNLGITVIDERAAYVQRPKDSRPTAGTIVLTSSYVLTRARTGEAVATGTRRISSSYDRSRQEFAALRAERDAENRAARELAELLRLALAQDILKAQ